MPRKTSLPNEFFETNFLILYQTESSARMKIRYLGLLHLTKGKTIIEVSKMLCVSPRTVAYWINRYKKEGIDGLKDKPGRGAKTKLPKEHETKLCETVLVMQEERKGGRVKGEDVRKMLADKFNVFCSLSGVYSLLHRVGLSWITSRSKHPKQSEEVQELFKKTLQKSLSMP